MDNCRNKPKLNVVQQVEHLKSKGVKFGIVNEKCAYDFLTKNNYFFKLTSYRTNYEKNSEEKYKDLEFAYLVDLSTIDMHLRRFALRVTLDIEHMLKTKLLADFNSSTSDGYDIVHDFLKDSKGEKTREYLMRQCIDAKSGKNYSPNSPILLKYDLNLAIWNFVEVIQFGHLITFCNYFYDKFPNSLYKKVKNDLFSIKCLRNASAHNNCILLLKAMNNDKPQYNTSQFIMQNFTTIFEDESFKPIVKSFLKNHTIHDFITSLIVFDTLCTSIHLKHHYFRELQEFFDGRLLKHKDYYQNNELLKNAYKCVYSVVNYFQKKYPVVI
ncbi:MAG: Abi family protein [Campylobacteraceae bacterium]|jgi:hypothetical protein|nr:Abi family protein [Campylobacteraceae bacterium]